MGRFLFLDALRGIAAFLVLLQHAIVPVMGGNDLFFFREIFNPGKFGVVWFFIISGFLIPSSLNAKYGLKGFAISRFFRLYPVYWFSLFLYLFSLVVTSTPLPQLSQIFANLTMLHYIFLQADIVPVYWTLFIELVFYFICASLFFAGILGDIRIRFSVSIAFLILTLAASLVRGYLEVKLPIALILAISIMFFGSILRDYMTGDRYSIKFIFIILFLYILVLPVSFYNAYSFDAGFQEHYSRYTITYLLAIFSFLIFVFFNVSMHRHLMFLGLISYSLYVIHPSVMHVVEYVSNSFFYGYDYFWSAVVVILSVAISKLSYEYIERPMIDIGRRVRNGLIVE